MASTTHDTTHDTTHREGRFERTSDPQTTASPLEQHSAPTADTKERSGRATAAFITGIVGVLLAVAIAILGLIVGVIATVLGATSRKDAARQGKSNVWMGTTGMVLGIIAIVGAIANIAFAAAIMAS